MLPLPAWIADFRPPVLPHEDRASAYYSYLVRAIGAIDERMNGALYRGGRLDQRFGGAELVVPGYRRKELPPVELWPNFIPALAMTMLVRQGMVLLGHGPLQVVATYRPEGGAAKSLHKVNRAIDLSPVHKTQAACQALVRVATWVYQQHEHLQVGVGTYGPYTDRSTLIHIDACGRKGRKSWRQIKGVSVGSAVRGQPPVLLGMPAGG